MIGDAGPNTGGMGAICAKPFGSLREIAALCEKTIIEPTLQGFREEGVSPLPAVSFSVLIAHPAGPVVIEYNCRFGDPETGGLCSAFFKANLADILVSCTNQNT
jgi:phosphoribosylamine--glycine ligase